MKNKVIFPLILILNAVFSSLLSASFLYPTEYKDKLLLPIPNSLSLLFTGDTQYHFPCTEENRDCKLRAQKCVLAQNAARKNASASKWDDTIDNLIFGRNCLQVESEFANDVQRKSIFHLIRMLEKSGQTNKPVALIINGDLTNFGHSFQLELFKNEWLRTIPIPMLIGLGNHDYENNVDDCLYNNCAERMLRWFSQVYAPSMGDLMANLDLKRDKEMWRAHFEGSLAYSSKLCATATEEAKNASRPQFCVHSIQLHNRPDYAATLQTPLNQWHIRGSFQWLLAELDRIVDNSRGQKRIVVLINLHNLSGKVVDRLRGTLELWERLNRVKMPQLTVHFMVLFAHIHENHSVAIRCINGRKVPHIFVGSVPNNRYTLIRFTANEDGDDETGQLAADLDNKIEIYLMKANANSTTEIVQLVNFEWTQC